MEPAAEPAQMCRQLNRRVTGISGGSSQQGRDHVAVGQRTSGGRAAKSRGGGQAADRRGRAGSNGAARDSVWAAQNNVREVRNNLRAASGRRGTAATGLGGAEQRGTAASGRRGTAAKYRLGDAEYRQGGVE